VPDGCPELILHLGDPFARRVGRRWTVQPRAFLAGPLTRPWTLRAGRRVCTVGLRFRPGATTSPFPIELHAAADREVPLAHLVGTEGAQALLHALDRAPTRTLRFRAVQGWLRSRIASSGPRGGEAREAVQLVLRGGGRRRVDEIADALGWSRRRLERVFARHVGLRPKLFARIVRINAVLAGLDAEERAAAVDLALEAGYFDQAHLLRDFRALVGRTPRSGRESDGELARHFTDPGRLLALLAGDDASHSSKPRRPRPA
jgi:AraC-like DNA-binding protein